VGEIETLAIERNVRHDGGGERRRSRGPRIERESDSFCACQLSGGTEFDSVHDRAAPTLDDYVGFDRAPWGQAPGFNSF